MRRKRNATKMVWLSVLVVGVILILGVGIGFLVKANAEKTAVFEKYPDRGVPRIDINLNGVSLEEIDGGSKDVKYGGNGMAIYDGDEVLEYDGVEVKGRGNGTWAQEKKPYQIKFGNKVDLFGMGKARKWYLLANAMDGTNLRTEVAFYLARMLDENYPFEGEFVELYIDGDYRGLYYLTHAVEIGKQVVDLRSPLGVLVELDNVYGWTENYYLTGNGDLLVIKDIVVDDNEKIAMEDFLESYNEFEIAVRERDYERITNLVDVESFAKYYLLNEFIVNPDAYWTSFYLYKDGPEDKIHAGPGWDFDLAFANRNWGNWMGEEFYSPARTMIRRGELQPREFYIENGMEIEYEISLTLSHIMFNLTKMPEFIDEVKMVYNDRMAGREVELMMMFALSNEKIRSAALADGEKWGKGIFEDEIKKMSEWMEARYSFFEQEYGDGVNGWKKID